MKEGYLILSVFAALVVYSQSTQGRVKRAVYDVYEAQFSQQLDVCSGQINSQGFPQSYQNGAVGFTVIKAPEGHKASVTVEILDVESSVDCVNDHLTIYNGQDAGSPVLAKLCGSLMDFTERKFTASGRRMFIAFHSNNNGVNGNGYLLSYQSIAQAGAVTPCSSSTIVNPCSAGNMAILKSSNGVITSPNYPGSYPNQVMCRYSIDVTEHGNKIDIDWTSFSLENANNCIYDSVIIYEMGLNEAGGPYCGTNRPPDDTTAGPYYFVTFRADASVVSSGFRLTFSARGTPIATQTTTTTAPPTVATRPTTTTNTTTTTPTTTTTTQTTTTTPTTTTTTTTTPTTTTALPTIDNRCGFQGGIGCDWLVLSASGSTADFVITSGPTADYGRKGKGVSGGHAGSTYYVAIIASNHARGAQALIQVKPLSGSSSRCLSFWYSLSSNQAGSLSVHVGSPSQSAVWSRWSKTRGGWNKISISLTGITSSTSVYIKGVNGRNNAADLPLDDITLTSGPC